MKYMGSKSRHAKEIIPIIMRKHKPNMYYIEPFVGGGNVIDKIPCKKRIGCDSNGDVIKALISIRDSINSIPKDDLEFTEEQYKTLRTDLNYPFREYLGFVVSYGAKWLGGWSRGNNSKGLPRDYVKEGYSNALKQSPLLQGIALHHKSVFDIGTLKGKSTIYCDPPYEGTTRYKDDFNHDNFWQWCRDKVTQGHDVYVSEYNAPSDFVCIWEKGVNSSLTRDTGGKKAIERLFVHESQNS